MELQNERRTRQDRRNHLSAPRFPFVDGDWKVVSANRRAITNRRNEDFPIDEEKIIQLLNNISKGIVKLT